MKKKYVRVTYAGFFLFAEEVPHVHIEYIASQGGYRIISAGFWNLDDEGLAVCYGESVGLRVKSRPDDTDALREFLGQNETSAATGSEREDHE